MTRSHRHPAGQRPAQSADPGDPVVEDRGVAGRIGRDQAGLEVLPGRPQHGHRQPVTGGQCQDEGGAHGAVQGEHTADQHRQRS